VFALVTSHEWIQSRHQVESAQTQFFASQKAEESCVSTQQNEDSLTDLALTEALLPPSFIGARAFRSKIRALVPRQ
jgi:hypothetical protein